MSAQLKPHGKECVLKAVTEQIKNFHVTKYQDGRHPAEVYLEKHLKFAKGAFSLSDEFLDAPESFLACLRYLGGPRLFPAAPLCADNNEDIPTPTAANEQFVQSFRSDRRLLRLVIVRCFADMLRRKYTRECPSAGGDAPSATQHALFDNCSNNDESIEPLKSTNAIKFNGRNARVLQ
ncbi:hypothetical protein DYB32_004245 [Aphanomyces invadans]|uniref:Uncharacterized protein n=1 Tax=Aphanomyces invadans TaxID=157072 RepID=A0A3R6VYA8_9STRA|nr:hypothetical protein DYB32_004245 [Aphanomyces invadans]